MIEKNTQQSRKIRKGDIVMAIAGNERGSTGTVLSCSSEKAVVQGLNMRKRHVKKSQLNPKGSIISFEAPIHISNLKVFAGDKPVKLKVNVDHSGNRQFVYKNGDDNVVYRSVKKPKE
jgi:large subunit ribosomal protein L24